MTDDADSITQRNALERAAARNELKEAIRSLEGLCDEYKSESYRQAWKIGSAFLKSRLIALC